MKLVNKNYNFEIELDIDNYIDYKETFNLNDKEAKIEYIEVMLENLKYDLLDENSYEIIL